MHMENKQENLFKAMNVPPRDEKKYPMLSQEDQMKAGLFCYQLALIGNCVDGNLQALVWDMYLQISNYLKEEGLDDHEGRIYKLLNSLDYLKKYVETSRNPVFNKLPPKEKWDSQSVVKGLDGKTGA